MCPTAAKGRAAVLPMFLRAADWETAAEAVSRPIEAARARQFSVLAWDGRRAGVFAVAGAAELGMAQRVALGGYAGASPCTEPPQTGRERRVIAECKQHRAGCGLALAVLEPPTHEAPPLAEASRPMDVAIGGACVVDGKLLSDIDGDGRLEAYPTAAFRSASGGLADEVVATELGGATCLPQFAIAGLAAGQADDGMSLLGVLDIDGDGRHELIVSYLAGEASTWAIYSPLDTPGRLDRVAEATSWPRQ